MLLLPHSTHSSLFFEKPSHETTSLFAVRSVQYPLYTTYTHRHTITAKGDHFSHHDPDQFLS